MAAIDKLYVNNYQDYSDLKLWCLINKPTMLKNFYEPFLTETELNNHIQERYNNYKERVTNSYEKFDGAGGLDACIVALTKHYYKIQSHINNVDEHFQAISVKCKNDIADEANEIIYNYITINTYKPEIPIANFSFKQDKYLLWKCPLDFVRDYLKENCDYTTKWYHKLFFKK